MSLNRWQFRFIFLNLLGLEAVSYPIKRARVKLFFWKVLRDYKGGKWFKSFPPPMLGNKRRP